MLSDARGDLLAVVVRAGALPDKTDFMTSPDLPLQLGYIVYPTGGQVPRHFHKPVQRTLTSTAEVLLVQQGRCRLDLFDSECQPVTSRELVAGDVVLLLAGGHGFQMLEPTVFLEIKQGPYGGLDEKERF